MRAEARAAKGLAPMSAGDKRAGNGGHPPDKAHPRPQQPRGASEALIAIAEPFNPGPCTLLDLTAHRCKWPLGDPILHRESFRYCGAAKDVAEPYCLSHMLMGLNDRSPMRATIERRLRECAG